jgi:hypothetical protein
MDALMGRHGWADHTRPGDRVADMVLAMDELQDLRARVRAWIEPPSAS